MMTTLRANVLPWHWERWGPNVPYGDFQIKVTWYLVKRLHIHSTRLILVQITLLRLKNIIVTMWSTFHIHVGGCSMKAIYKSYDISFDFDMPMYVLATKAYCITLMAHMTRICITKNLNGQVFGSKSIITTWYIQKPNRANSLLLYLLLICIWNDFLEMYIFWVTS